MPCEDLGPGRWCSGGWHHRASPLYPAAPQMGIAYQACPSPETAAETQQLMKTARDVRVRSELAKLLAKEAHDGIVADARRLYERRQMEGRE